MSLNKFASIAMAIMLATTLASCSKQEEAKVDKTADKAAAEVKAKAEADAKAAAAAAKELEAREVAIEAYVYAYPLVTMEMTRRVMTNVAAPEGTRAPMGQLRSTREPIPTPSSGTSPRRTPTRSTRRRGSTWRRSPGC